MKPLIVLLATFVLALLITWIFQPQPDYTLAGNIGMSAMLVFTAIGHFKFTDGMAMMLPDFIPFKTSWVYATGVIEVVAAIGLLFPDLRYVTATCLMLFFLSIIPANISAAIRNVDYQTGDTKGPGPNYLWFRIPLQIFFIFWIWYFGIKLP